MARVVPIVYRWAASIDGERQCPSPTARDVADSGGLASKSEDVCSVREGTQMTKFLAGLISAVALTAGSALGDGYDVGSKADIVAVQTEEHRIAPSHNHVLGVHVDGNYALLLFWAGTTFTPGIEQHDAFKRTSGQHWTRIYSGQYACTQLVKHGVTPAVEHQLCSGWGDVGS